VTDPTPPARRSPLEHERDDMPIDLTPRDESQRVWGVVANVKRPVQTSLFRPGARIVISWLEGSGESCRVIGKNRHGRTVYANISLSHLENIRVAFIHEAMPKYSDVIFRFATREEAEKIARAIETTLAAIQHAKEGKGWPAL